MCASTIPALFRPINVGDVQLAHRVVLPPMTRARATESHVPTDIMVEYYRQRSCVPGTLLITEGTLIVPQAGGQYPRLPGIWSEEQINAWKKIADAIHANKGAAFMQLWAMGRVSRPDVLKQEDPDFEHVGPSAIALKARPDEVPRALTKEGKPHNNEIEEWVQFYATAAKNAVKAGFDDVEVHGANGYLVDQFIQPASNTRTDEYGGSIENRARFALRVMDAIVNAIGESKAAIRLSPWSICVWKTRFRRCYIAQQLKERHPNLAYLHVIAPGSKFNRGPEDPSAVHFMNEVWAPRPVISTGGYTRETALKTAKETGQLIGFGEAFLATPDLPYRLHEGLPFNEPDLASIYSLQQNAADGYLSYPFSDQLLEAHPEYKN